MSENNENNINTTISDINESSDNITNINNINNINTSNVSNDDNDINNTSTDSNDNNVNLTLSHNQNMVKIIELCSGRGAFKANELELVGNTYNTLVEFLKNLNSKLNKE
jgi:hypothetical protein